MDKRQWGILAVLGGIAAYIYYQNSQTPVDSTSNDALNFSNDPLSSISDALVSATAGWKNVGMGPTWVPALNAAEVQWNIPTDLLARIAYAESHFRDDIISGETASSAGALGLMQLEPAYFQSVRVPTPFSADDTMAQIQDGAQDLVTNYHALGNWPQAVAAYNAGLTTIQKGNASAANAATTAAYVAQILADVPAANS
jgi:soluble lytic murein transglycosylase-like protein